MGQLLTLPFRLWKTTWTYYSGLYYYAYGRGRTDPYDLEYSPVEGEHAQYARIHLYSLATALVVLYNQPHYRKGSYRTDLVDNLRNVAIPGTGIPLSWLVGTRLTAMFLLIVIYPFIALVASLHYAIHTKKSVSDEFSLRLLAPNDWFSLWRLNCNIVGLHSLVLRADESVQKDYNMENKWTFLEHGVKVKIPVSPVLTTPSLVVKHKNEEGGMGIYFFENAVNDGDWIIQERLENADWVNDLLPSNAPLSTFRVITSSKASFKTTRVTKKDIDALACVFRAGREGAATDHDSILFDVNIETGEILRGTTNAHWYRLYQGAPWRSWDKQYTHHPDAPEIGVTGQYVPDIDKMIELVQNAHAKMCPRVPLAGWDVVFTSHKIQTCLLEVNLSCNFFRGSFDLDSYLDFCDASLQHSHEILLMQQQQEKSKSA